MSAFPGEIYRNALESCLSSRVATKHRNIFQDNLIDEQIWRNFSNKSFPAGSANLDEVVRCGCTLTQKHRGKKLWTLCTSARGSHRSISQQTTQHNAKRILLTKLISSSSVLHSMRNHTQGKKWNKYCENIKNIEQYYRKIIGKDIKKYFEKYRRGQATTDYWWRLWRKSVWEPQMCKAFDQSSKGGQWSTWFYFLKKN